MVLGTGTHVTFARLSTFYHVYFKKSRPYVRFAAHHEQRSRLAALSIASVFGTSSKPAEKLARFISNCEEDFRICSRR